jgi:hypothetical protein
MGVKTVATTTLAAPINCTATATAGGSLAASTTYYYVVIACYTASGNANQMDCESVISAEFSATTDATNKQISLTWDAVTGANRYVILRTTTSGDYGTNTTHMVMNGSAYYHSTNSFVDTGAALSTVVRWLVLTSGMPAVYVSGGSDADRITEDFIYDAMVTAGLSAFCQKVTDYLGNGLFYKFHCGMLIGVGAGGTAYVRWGGNKQFLFDGYQSWGGSADQICGTLVNDSHGYNGSSFSFTGKSTLSTRMQLNGYLRFYGCQFIDATASYYSSPSAYGAYYQNSMLGAWTGNTSAAPSKIYNCIIGGVSGNNQFNGYLTFKNCFLKQSRVRLEGTIPPSFINCNFDAQSCYSYGSTHAVMVGANFLYAPYEMTMHGTTTTKHFTYVDPVFFNTPIKTDAISNPSYSKYVVRFSMTLKILDSNGDPIEGATITVKDKNGYSYVYTDLTAKATSTLNETGTVVNVSDATGISIGNYILLNEEILLVTNINSYILTVTRAQRGTLANYHSVNGTVIKLGRASMTTDSSGNSATLKLIKARYDYDSAPAAPYKYAITTFAPYTIKVSASGYKSYEEEITPTAAINKSITLKPTKDIIDENGNYYIANDETSDLLKDDGNNLIEL